VLPLLRSIPDGLAPKKSRTLTKSPFSEEMSHCLTQGSERGMVAGQAGRPKVVRLEFGDVRFGSKAEIHLPSADVRFTPKKQTLVERVGMSA